MVFATFAAAVGNDYWYIHTLGITGESVKHNIDRMVESTLHRYRCVIWQDVKKLLLIVFRSLL